MRNFVNTHRRLLLVLIPTLIGILYITLCALNLTQSIWFDESYGAYITRFGFGDIWRLTAADVHPPLFYFLLKIWTTIFGSTDFAMRFMSVLFGAIAIVFAFQLIKRYFGAKSATIATLFMALSPILIRYGQEMRMYTLAAALVMAASYILALAVDTKKRRYWLVYGILISLGMWTHYFTALVWVAHLIWLIITYRKKIFQKDVIIAYVVAVALYIPWIPSFLAQSASVQGGFWIGEATLMTVTDFFMNALVYLDTTGVKGWILPLLLAVIAGLVILLPRLYRSAKKPLRSPYLFLLLMAFVPPLLLLLLSLPPMSPVFVDRYLTYSAVTISLLIGLALSRLSPKRASTWLFAAIFLASSVIGVVNVENYGNYNKDADNKSDVKTLIETVSANSFEGEPIVSRSEWIFYDAVFYSSDEHPIYFTDEYTDYIWGSHEPLKTMSVGKIDDLDKFIEENDTFWWIDNSDGETDPELPRDDLVVVQKLYTNTIVPDKTGYAALELKKL